MSAFSQWVVDLPDLAATEALARDMAPTLSSGDIVTLSGDLGAGKTAFARALIRSLADDPALDVPSPTFTLIQTYETPRLPVVHADLYRIASPDELDHLGWDEAGEDALVLLEWPERAGGYLPADRLDIALAHVPGHPTARQATITGAGNWSERLARQRALETLLKESGWSDATRVPIQGDASTRAYERLVRQDPAAHPATAILMIAPRRADGPPIRWGKSYSTLAKLSESVHAFVAMADGLRAQGLSAPAIHHRDLETGLLIVEDLGGEGVLDATGEPIPERYRAAAALLADLHGRDLPPRLPVKGDEDYALPVYDLDALLIEAELLLDWYMPWRAGKQVSGSIRSQFVSLWRRVLEPVIAEARTWTLRDYHSPNLLWLAEREGVRRVGIIDFQDAVIGHPAYDLASLLQDARLAMPEERELDLFRHYLMLRRNETPDFDLAGFAAAYAVIGAQRVTKVLGIFVRLDQRDRKPAYLRHIPHMEAYLRRNLAHPVLCDLKAWYEQNLPDLFVAPET
jgi:tRNA threonylcarbamoyl adenosine modification protein YjeE